MAEIPRIDEGRGITEVKAPVVSTAITPAKAPKSALASLAEALNIIDPAAKALAREGIEKSAAADALKAAQVAKDILAQGDEKRSTDETLQAWQDATNENPTLMGLNPFAQAKARKDIARASARALEPELLAMVEEVNSDIDSEENFTTMAAAITTMRQEKLEALGITDIEEIASFNSEFNQMEQNFTAQYNGKVAQLRRTASLDRFGSQVQDVASDIFHPIFNVLVPNAGQQFGEKVTAITKSFENEGVLLRTDRNKAVLSSVFDSIVELHQETGSGLNLLDAGALENSKLSLDAGDDFTLANINQGKFAKDLRAALMRIDQQKEQARLEAQDLARKDMKAAYRGAAKATSKLPPSQRGDADAAMEARFNNQTANDLMGPTWPSDMDNIQNAERAGTKQNAQGDFDGGSRSPRYTSEWVSKISDYSTSYTNWSAEAAQQLADGHITLAEWKVIDTQITLRDAAFEDSAITPLMKKTNEIAETVLDGADIRDSKIMQQVRELSFTGSGKTPSPARQQAVMLYRSRVAAETLKLLDTQDPEQRQQIQLNITNLGAELQDSVFGTADRIAADDQEAKQLSATKIAELKQAPNLNHAEMMSQPLAERLDIADTHFSDAGLKVKYPNMSDEVRADVATFYQEVIRNDPRNITPHLFDKGQGFATLRSFSESLSDYDKQLKSLELAEGDAFVERSALIVKNSSNILSEISQAEDNLGALTDVPRTTNARDFSNILGEASQFDVRKEGLALEKDMSTRTAGEASKAYIGSLITKTTVNMTNNDIEKHVEDIDSLLTQQKAIGEMTNLFRDSDVRQSSVSGRVQMLTLPQEVDGSHLWDLFLTDEIGVPPWVEQSVDGKTFVLRSSGRQRAEIVAYVYKKPLATMRKFHNSQLKTNRKVLAENDRQQRINTEAARRTAERDLTRDLGDLKETRGLDKETN